MEYVVFSGSRADMGPLMPVVKALNAKLIRLTRREASTPQEVSAAVAGVIDEITWTEYAPDFAIILGDRWDALGAATALYLLGIPIVHLSGGDVTEGSQDDSMRHAITKLSHVHFPTHKAAAKRILAMGEETWRVHTVGCPGIDQLMSTTLLSQEATLRKLCVTEPYILVSYQPETLAADPVKEGEALIEALYRLQLPCVFTTLNADVGSAEIQRLFERFCVQGRRGVIMDMPQNLYLSAMKHCKVMIGNSSSGLYEAPTLKVPFVNVGNRQLGRPAANNVFWSPNEPDAICRAVGKLLQGNFAGVVNPYGDGRSAERIRALLVDKFSKIPRQQLLTKKFVDIDD